MARYLAAIFALSMNFLGITAQAILRGSNEAIDELDKKASFAQRSPANIFYEVL